MTAWTGSLHFIEPRWLWLLVLVPLVAWLIGRRSAEMRVLTRLADPLLLPHLLDGKPGASRAPVYAFIAAALLAVLALSAPSAYARHFSFHDYGPSPKLTVRASFIAI